MKYFWILMICTGSCFGQTRTQLKQQLAEADDFIRTLVSVNASLRAQLDQVNIEKKANQDAMNFILNLYLEQGKELEILKLANASLSGHRTVVVTAWDPPPPQVIQHTTVIREDKPYRPPALDWPSSVNCSGYEIPTPGLTLTYQNCQ